MFWQPLPPLRSHCWHHRSAPVKKTHAGGQHKGGQGSQHEGGHGGGLGANKTKQRNLRIIHGVLSPVYFSAVFLNIRE